MMIKQVLMYFVQYGCIYLDIVPSFPWFFLPWWPSQCCGGTDTTQCCNICVCEGQNLKVNQGTSLQAIPRVWALLSEETALFLVQNSIQVRIEVGNLVLVQIDHFVKSRNSDFWNNLLLEFTYWEWAWSFGFKWSSRGQQLDSICGFHILSLLIPWGQGQVKVRVWIGKGILRGLGHNNCSIFDDEGRMEFKTRIE